MGSVPLPDGCQLEDVRTFEKIYREHAEVGSCFVCDSHSGSVCVCGWMGGLVDWFKVRPGCLSVPCTQLVPTCKIFVSSSLVLGWWIA